MINFKKYWPFPRTPKPTWAERVAHKPDPPCGQKESHYDWEYNLGMPCPMCAGIEERKQKMEDEDRLARKIAKAIMDMRYL